MIRAIGPFHGLLITNLFRKFNFSTKESFASRNCYIFFSYITIYYFLVPPALEFKKFDFDSRSNLVEINRDKKFHSNFTWLINNSISMHGLRKYCRLTSGFLQPEITIKTSTCATCSYIISSQQFRSSILPRLKL